MTADLRDIPVRFSHLRAYGRSALHGYHARLDELQKPTTAMQRGTATPAPAGTESTSNEYMPGCNCMAVA